MKAKSNRFGRGKQIAALVGGLAAGAAGIAYGEGAPEKPFDYQTYQSGKETTIQAEAAPAATRQVSRQPVTWFQSDNLVYAMYGQNDISPVDSSAAIIQSQNFKTEAEKSWAMAERKTSAGARALSCSMYTPSNWLVNWSDKTLSLGNFLYVHDANGWFLDGDYSGDRCKQELGMNSTFNLFANAITTSVTLEDKLLEEKLLEDKRNALEEMNAPEDTTEDTTKTSAPTASATSTARTADTSARDSFYEKQEELARRLRSVYSRIIVPTGASQSLSIATVPTGIPQSVYDSMRPEELEAIANANKPVAVASSAQTGALTLEDIRAAYSASMLYPTNSSAQASAMTDEQRLEALAREGPRSENTMSGASTTEQVSVTDTGAQTEMTLAEADRIEREHHAQGIKNVQSRYTPSPVQAPKAKEKLKFPGLGLTLGLDASFKEPAALGGNLGIRLGNPEGIFNIGVSGSYQNGLQDEVSVVTDPESPIGLYAIRTVNSQFSRLRSLGVDASLYFGGEKAHLVLGGGYNSQSWDVLHNVETRKGDVIRYSNNALDRMVEGSVRGYMGLDFKLGKNVRGEVDFGIDYPVVFDRINPVTGDVEHLAIDSSSVSPFIRLGTTINLIKPGK
ncbi:MAG: hypothetical protein PHH00_02000 [Candidatus Nanoarchaeia archaeon]|nr:hypothetical protein [Candidatus Nanoarchaeia archaeon]